jgi:hypothetical protein
MLTIFSSGVRNRKVANSSVAISSNIIAANPATCVTSTSRVSDGSNKSPLVNTCFVLYAARIDWH